MEQNNSPETKRHTYQITYGVAIIILTLVLNDMALYLITGHSIFPITYNAPISTSSYVPQDTMMQLPVKEVATSTASTTAKLSH